MYLSQEQVASYKNTGLLLLPEYFSHTEIDILRSELPDLFAEESQRRVLENDGKTVRSLHGSHMTNEVFSCVSRLSRMVEPAMQMLESKVYVHQFKINLKAALSGDVWKWHQDFIFWRKEDGMPTPRVVNVMILLNDMNEFNGPLYVMPGSHKEGMIDLDPATAAEHTEKSKDFGNKSAWLANFSANLKYSFHQQMIAELASKYGISSIKAPAGSVLFFDSNIVHASPSNISPFDRATVIVTYNSIENVPFPIDNPRPEFLVSRNYQPIDPISDQLLLAFNRSNEKEEVFA